MDVPIDAAYDHDDWICTVNNKYGAIATTNHKKKNLEFFDPLNKVYAESSRTITEATITIDQ